MRVQGQGDLCCTWEGGRHHLDSGDQIILRCQGLPVGAQRNTVCCLGPCPNVFRNLNLTHDIHSHGRLYGVEIAVGRCFAPCQVR